MGDQLLQGNAPEIHPKRKPEETYEDYRKRLEEQHADLKRYLKGKMVWRSARMYFSKDKGAVKFKVQGTYNAAKNKIKEAKRRLKDAQNQ